MNASLALECLHEMAIALDGMAELSRYETQTNNYQAALIDAYQKWVKGLMRGLSGDAVGRSQEITARMPDLQQALQNVAQEQLPAAIQVLGHNYVPSPDAWHMIGDAVTQANAEIDTRLIPDIEEKLQRALIEGADVEAVAQSLEPRVAQYAGAFWTLIQRGVGDYAAQAQTRDDVIYRCRWVRIHDDASCQACIEYEGEYDSYNAMLEQTNQSVPGYFANSPYLACWGNDRCHLELFINGNWVRV